MREGGDTYLDIQINQMNSTGPWNDTHHALKAEWGRLFKKRERGGTGEAAGVGWGGRTKHKTVYA